jgi:uncharacterized membrane protein YkoI
MSFIIGSLAMADEGYQHARRLTDSGVILPLDDLMQAIQSERPGQILDVELEHESGLYVYEIEILDPRGEVWEFKVDATNGEILEREREN